MESMKRTASLHLIYGKGVQFFQMKPSNSLAFSWFFGNESISLKE